MRSLRVPGKQPGVEDERTPGEGSGGQRVLTSGLRQPFWVVRKKSVCVAPWAVRWVRVEGPPGRTEVRRVGATSSDWDEPFVVRTSIFLAPGPDS